jgi:hypothetical protein
LPDFRIFRTNITDAATERTAAKVATIVTATVSPIIDETWQPRGLVRTSHLSSGCGQISLLKAGARNGIACSFGTQDHVYASTSQYAYLKKQKPIVLTTQNRSIAMRENFMKDIQRLQRTKLT